MQVGMIGFGRMGANMARRLIRGGQEVVGWNRTFEVVEKLAGEGVSPARTLEEAAGALASPRVFWVMLPMGEATDEAIDKLLELGNPGDIIVNGGNTFYRDDIHRAKVCAEKGMHYVDVGVSGGIWGLERGYCLMIGGAEEPVRLLDPIFNALAPGLGTIPRTQGRDQCDERAEKGYAHVGPAGAGHFVKMVHNGIEYGLMQAYAEGFDILRHRHDERVPEDERFDISLPEVAEVWRRGSVISSWLLDLCAAALVKDKDLSEFTGRVDDTGEGRWTIDAAMQEAVPAIVLSAALFARYRSRVDTTFGNKLLSAMRFGFGGHAEVPQ